MFDGRQLLSDSQYRKRKAEKEADLKKQSGSLKKMFDCAFKSIAKCSDNVIYQDNAI